MLAICGSRDYIFFTDAAVTERSSQTRSLRTYLEEEVDLLGAEAGGKLRSAILKSSAPKTSRRRCAR
eukprot:877528-Pleurochrysis_carterae.AAC.1